MNKDKMVNFVLGDMVFEYDEDKNQKNIQKHGISFRNAARVFFDYDRIEFYDEGHSGEEDRYNTIGNIGIGNPSFADIMIGKVNDILFVVYTERIKTEKNGLKVDIIRLISARLATNFERGIYYGKYE